MMHRFAEISEAAAATSKKNEKVRLVAGFLRSLPADEAAGAAIFFTGRAFPRSEETVLGVGSSLIWQAVARVSGIGPDRLEKIYRKYGDLGSVAEEVLETRAVSQRLSLRELEALFRELATRRGPAQKSAVLDQLLGRATGLEAKYVIKIATGDLRIGLKESLVEEAIAQAFDRPLDSVRRANMLTGDIAETLRLAAADHLASARLRLLHPIGFMLASPVEDPGQVLKNFPSGVFVEDKFDGIRAQAHKEGQIVKLFSRTFDEVVEFPELVEPVRSLPGEFILDGEILGWRDAHPLPFTELQKRLGRKQPDLWLDQQVPVRFVVFDLPYQNGQLLLEETLRERRRRLEALFAGTETSKLQLAPVEVCRSAEQLSRAFNASWTSGHEGVMAKGPDSPYTPGRRGQFWFKSKHPPHTLDVVVTAVEYGHGKRRGLLSDYTFSVRDNDRLVSIGKAYSGLTDAEIRRCTEYFLEHTIEDQGFRRRVEPAVVLEVAFNNIQLSSRHDSGYALRFPRIVRLRPDKSVEEIDVLDRVRQLYEAQRRDAKAPSRTDRSAAG